jgi:hypothetical protein
MEIKEHRLKQFAELYKELYGKTLTADETFIKASLLLQYGQLCIRPLAKIVEADIINMSNESE